MLVSLFDLAITVGGYYSLAMPNGRYSYEKYAEDLKKVMTLLWDQKLSERFWNR